jgi:hypothetical protein
MWIVTTRVLHGPVTVAAERGGLLIRWLKPNAGSNPVVLYSNGQDGISYLMRAKENGIVTPLSGAYEEEIKRRLNATDLEEALRKVCENTND